jgi:hypothetical protein
VCLPSFRTNHWAKGAQSCADCARSTVLQAFGWFLGPRDDLQAVLGNSDRSCAPFETSLELFLVALGVSLTCGEASCSKLCVDLTPEALLACAPLGCLWVVNAACVCPHSGPTTGQRELNLVWIVLSPLAVQLWPSVAHCAAREHGVLCDCNTNLSVQHCCNALLTLHSAAKFA